jgi:hypothetical protein
MTKEVQLKITKPDNEDFDTTLAFLNMMGKFFDSRKLFQNSDNWCDLPDDDADKIELLKIRQRLATEFDTKVEYIDIEQVLYEYIKYKYEQCDCHWLRVVLSAKILIANFCDPEAETLELHPIYARAIDEGYFGE